MGKKEKKEGTDEMDIHMITIKHKQGCLYKAIYEAIKNEILHANMTYGDRLPSIRQCATQLQVSKTSVERAYQQLLLEGWIESKIKKGYYVAVNEEYRLLRSQFQKESNYKKEKVFIDLTTRAISYDYLDTSAWCYYMKKIMKNKEFMISYGDAQGEWSLRNQMKHYLYANRNVVSKEDQMIIGNSIQSLLILLCNLDSSKKIIAIEQHRFLKMEQVFKDCNCEILYFTEESNMEDIFQKASYLYINSSSYGKHKASITKEKTLDYLEMANRYQTYIIEDDYNGEIRYISKMQPAMKSYDTFDRVIYIRSFSKMILPSSRISILILPQKLLKTYNTLKCFYNPIASKIEQEVLAYYIQDHHLKKRIKKMNRTYKKLYDRLSETLLQLFPKQKIVFEENIQVFYIQFSSIEACSYFYQQMQAHHIKITYNTQAQLLFCFSSLKEEQLEQIFIIIQNIQRSSSSNFFITER